MEDELSQTAAEAALETSVSDDEASDVRTRRLAEYMASSLAKDDPLAANLGAVHGDLMLLEYRMRQALDGLFDTPPESLQELQAAMPGVEGYLKVTKQIDRFAQLAMKLAATQASD